jgi:hypothetical protein
MQRKPQPLAREKEPTNIFELIRKHPEYNKNNSLQWFIKNVKDLSNNHQLGPMKMLGDNILKQKNEVMIGNMYMYTYSAKYKDKLPYWDRFPLIVVINKSKGSFLGINFHYLPPKYRVILLNKLMMYATDQKLNEKARLRLTWETLKGASRFKEVRPCIKRYLKSHVKSRLLRISPQDWPLSIFLPLERFGNMKATSVWEKSREIMLPQPQLGTTNT